jgi:hypothetical protein
VSVASNADLADTVRTEAADPTGMTDVSAAGAALRSLAGRAYIDGDTDAYSVHQAVLFDLHYSPRSASHWKRQFLASCVYDIEAQRVAASPVDGPMLTGAELRHRLWTQQEELTPLHHPMFQLLFSDDVSIEQVKIYLRQQWLILQFFWLQFVELAGELERREAPIGSLIVAYENVWDELGEGDEARSHIVQHRERQQRLGLGTDFRLVPDFAETMDYINTRLRFMRAGDPSAALGSIFSQEATAQSYGAAHHAMLRRVGIASRYGEVYAQHTTIDVGHTEDVIRLAESLMTTRAQQENLLGGHRAQMLIWLSHMDRVVALLRGEEQPPPRVPSLVGPRQAR